LALGVGRLTRGDVPPVIAGGVTALDGHRFSWRRVTRPDRFPLESSN
jgi:hypothetical protein